ncbi:MAG: Flp pilus assembly complex ATPase component TadA [Planctomycetes bacterium]|nr:Flp pilus assembly complex ATPase component TadA [Planctomycetota bacterium]
MEDTRLGAILLESGIVSEQDLERCLSIQALTGSVRPIGQVLVAQGLVDSETLSRVLELQKARKSRAAQAATVASSDDMCSALLQAAVANAASEMVVSEGRTVRIRVGTEWRGLTEHAVAGPQVWDFARELLGHEVLEELADRRCVVRGFKQDGVGHGTARVFRHFEGVAVRLQFAAQRIEPDQIGVPREVVDQARSGRGLVLVASERGQGRGEALALLTKEAARDSASHVIVLDDEPLPWPSVPALFVRRRFGGDMERRAAAVRSAVRDDPDVLVIADIGEAETFEVALRAAEGGRLVIGHINASSVTAALNRILDFYPVHDVPRVRSSLAAVLRSLLVRQQMLHSNGNEPVIATEMLVVDDSVRDALRRGDLSDIALLLRMEGGQCGHTLDSSMLQLLVEGRVRMEDVFARAEEKAWVLERTRHLETVTE